MNGHPHAMFDELSERDFSRLAEFIQAHCGIRMPDAKRTMVEGRLRRRVRLLDLPDLGGYCHFLFEQGGLPGEVSHLIDAVTTNKTDFFREPDHFDFLCDQAIPSLLAQGRSERLIKLWSAACSNGAEVYSLAMVMAEMDLRRSGSRWSVLGTDICTQVLEQAERAVYAEEMIAPVPPSMRERYLMWARDDQRHEVRIVPELRRRVRFQHLNLMDQSYPVDHDVDVLFLRNLLIYFDKPTQAAVLGRLSGHLRPGGFLVLGHSESMAGSNLPLVQVAPTIYRRQGA